MPYSYWGLVGCDTAWAEEHCGAIVYPEDAFTVFVVNVDNYVPDETVSTRMIQLGSKNAGNCVMYGGEMWHPAQTAQ